MPRELVIGDALVPSILLLYVAALGLTLLYEWIAVNFGLHRYFWHPPLFRLALFVTLFGALSLLLL